MTTRRAVLAAAVGASAAVIAHRAFAQTPVQIGLLVPLSGVYARPGRVMRMGAQMGVADVNAAGGIAALGGAKLELVVLDSGDTTEKAKNAAQRMVAEYPQLVAGSGAYVSQLTIAATEVTERARLPFLTLAYSDLITSRGFNYVFQTSATAGAQAAMALPMILQLAESASARRPQTVAMVTDNTPAPMSSAKAMRGGLLAKNALQLVVDETFTPPLSDSTALVQKVRSRRPDLLFFIATVTSDVKLVLEKLAEFRLHIPTISFVTAMGEPDLLTAISPQILEGVMSAVANWASKGHEQLIDRFKRLYGEPWMTQNAISTYGDMWLIKAALEKVSVATREAVANTLHTIDAGAALYYPGGRLRFDEKGRRVGAGMTIIQWQNGVPVTVFPENLAMAKARWPRGQRLTENA